METSKLILISVVVTTLVCCLGVVQGFTYDDKEVETEEGRSAMFERWRSHHKLEEISVEAKKKQYKTFKSRLEHVHRTNKANLGFKLEMNKFAGMTREEIHSLYTGFKGAPPCPAPKDDKNDCPAPPNNDKNNCPPKDDTKDCPAPPKDDKNNCPPKDDKNNCPPNNCPPNNCPPKDDKNNCPPKDDKNNCPPKDDKKDCPAPPKDDKKDCPAPPKDDKNNCPPKDDKNNCPPKDDKKDCPAPPKDDKNNCPPKDDKNNCPAPPKDDKNNCPPKDDKKDCPPKGNTKDREITSKKDNWFWEFKYRNVTDVPAQMDWRDHNAVTRVKNQGPCGCCYAFPTVDAVEGLHAIVNKELVELSPKEILDCANVGGCNGGTSQDSFKYIAENGGLTTEKNYPYKPEVETCTLQKANDIAVEIHGYQDIPRDETDEHLLKAVANQPVAVATSWDDNLALYKEGIVSGECSTTVRHATLVIGYGTAPDGTKYWLLKNSWGEDWGDKGYFKMVRGIPDDKEGFCGIAKYPSFPIIEHDSGKHAEGGPVVKSIKEL